MSQTASPGARLRIGLAPAVGAATAACCSREAGAPDADLRADVLLAALTAEQVRHWLHEEGRSRQRWRRACGG